LEKSGEIGGVEIAPFFAIAKEAVEAKPNCTREKKMSEMSRDRQKQKAVKLGLCIRGDLV